MPCPAESLTNSTVSHPSRSALGGVNNATVAIVGGGLAGLAAACALSSIGFRVTLCERRPYLGGRASSYEHPGTGEIVDNCQHVLFQLCTNLIDFYRKIGIEDKIRWFDSMTFIEPGGRQSVLKPTSLPAPVHVTPSFLGLKFLGAGDKLRLTAALAILMFSQPTDDGTSFHDWLIRHHQTRAAIERFWKPILVSALSEDLGRISIPYAAQVVRESMRSRDARLMGVPSVPLTELYSAARDYVIAHGGDVRLRSNVRAFQPTEHGVGIELQDSEEEFDYVVLAIPFDALAKLLPDSLPSAQLREQISYFETSPITGVHFWFDRQITDLPHAVLIDRTIQWMFHKSLLLSRDPPEGVSVSRTARKHDAYQGASLAGPQDDPAIRPSRAQQSHSLANDSRESSDLQYENLSTLSPGGVGVGGAGETSPALQRGEQYEANRNPLETTGSPRSRSTKDRSYLELVISSSKSLISKSRQEIIDLALAELREFFPAARDANLVKATVIKELNATFSPKPGIDPHRPPAWTAWPRLFLAGDWTATGWPATMEGAVRSGYLAAEAITKKCGAPKKFLVPDLPPGGLMRFR
jgi:squalene-associated FAD-dependent desaturase